MKEEPLTLVGEAPGVGGRSEGRKAAAQKVDM